MAVDGCVKHGNLCKPAIGSLHIPPGRSSNPDRNAAPCLQVVLSNFGNSGEQVSLTAALFQGLFPPINVQKTSLAACKVRERCFRLRKLRLSRTRYSRVIGFRVPVGACKVRER